MSIEHPKNGAVMKDAMELVCGAILNAVDPEKFCRITSQSLLLAKDRMMKPAKLSVTAKKVKLNNFPQSQMVRCDMHIPSLDRCAVRSACVGLLL